MQRGFFYKNALSHIHMKNQLKKIFEKQRKLQIELGIYKRIQNPKLKQQYINQMILAIHEEATEIMRETPYKNPSFVPFGWKKTQIGDNNLCKDEIVDLMHFLVNISIAVGMNYNEFFERYINKNKKNLKRKQNGY
jgi:dimeric dUTPase (all-alpha-NTP-PPase superfamily)